MSHDKNYTDALLEEMRGDIKAILEVVIPMKKQVDRIPKIEEDIVDIKADLHAMKVTLKLTNDDVRDHERRITNLEQARA